MIYLSFGAGVQSSALLAMACVGYRDIPRPDVAIFADTQCEPSWVYQQLGWMAGFAKSHGVEVVSVTRGSLGHTLAARLRGERKSGSTIPVWVKGEDGREAPLGRNCTKDFKLDVIYREVARRLGRKRGQKGGPAATCLIGISHDERSRMKQAKRKWCKNTYPLVDLGITKHGCERYLESQGIPVPLRPACLFCPYHDDAYWADLKANHPLEWQEAQIWDLLFRDMNAGGVREQTFLHRSLTPLGLVDFHPRQKQQHATLFDPHGFENECEGMCGN